jgi:hypothetical protein
VLAIGDGYVFGEDRVRPGAEASSVDVVCQDLRDGASLRCPHGAVGAVVPLAAVGLPKKPTEVAALTPDAPAHVPDGDAWLLPRSVREHPGIAFVRGGDGRTWRVVLLAFETHPDARLRRARVGYAEVPSVEGGGVVRLPTTRRATDHPILTTGTLKAISAEGSRIPGDSFAHQVLGAYERLPERPPELVLEEEKYLLVDEPLDTSVTIRRSGAVLAAGGVAPQGKVVVDSYGGAAVRGDMAGLLHTKSYGYLHVEGDVTGTVRLDSYTTLVVGGDVRGKVEVRSYAKFLLRGRVLGTVDVQGACWSTFYFQGYWTREAIEAFGRGFGQVTLHVESSDLPVGKHEGVGSWRSVTVADPVWETLRR